MSETELEDIIKDKIRDHFGLHPDMKLFTNPVGKAWFGVAANAGAKVILSHPRRVDFGLRVGSSDLIGWITINGQAVFLALEVKTVKGKPTEDQLNFIAQVKAAGGIAGVVRSVEDVEKLLKEYQ